MDDYVCRVIPLGPDSWLERHQVNGSELIILRSGRRLVRIEGIAMTREQARVVLREFCRAHQRPAAAPRDRSPLWDLLAVQEGGGVAIRPVRRGPPPAPAAPGEPAGRGDALPPASPASPPPGARPRDRDSLPAAGSR